jgi:WD40 repeat protein
MGEDTAAPSRSEETKTKVFVSYAREDKAFVERLETALRAKSVEPLIDKSEIAPLERDWWKRIEDVIAQADSLVFVISPDSVASDVCKKELAFAQGLNKRLAPVVWRPTDDQAVPEALSKINYVFFDDVDFDASVETLITALTTDIDWVRKHTALGEAARRWSAAGRPGPRGLLLRSPVLEEAEQWIAGRPPDAPPATEDMQAFIAESRRAATRRRNVLTMSLGTGLAIALILAGFAFWQRYVAVQQRNQAFINQSRYLADLANRTSADGDVVTAMLIALEALPDKAGGIDRPHVPEAEAALWNARQQLQELKILISDPTLRVAVSSDSRRIITINENGARIWDATTGELFRSLQEPGRVYSVSFSPDGLRAVTSSTEKTAKIWNIEAGEVVLTLTGHTGPVGSAAYSADGRRIVTASDDKTARIWDAQTGKLLLTISHTLFVTDAVFSPDGRKVLTVSRGTTSDNLMAGAAQRDILLRIWDAATGKPLVDLTPAGWATKPAFSPDGRRVMVGFADHTAQIWDATSGKATIVLKGHSSFVTAASFSPDGRLVVTASDDKTVRLWDAATGEAISVLRGHLKSVRDAAFMRDGRWVVTTSEDRTVRVWDATGPAVVLLRGHSDFVYGAVFSADGGQVVTNSQDNTIRVWDVASRKDTLVIRYADAFWAPLALSDDGRKVAAGSSDPGAFTYSLRVWDAKTGRQLISVPHPGTPDSIAFSPDGRRLATTAAEVVLIWDAATGKPISTLKGHTSSVLSVAFSRDGKRLVSSSNDFTARIWDAGTGQQIAVMNGQSPILRAVFSPDGRRVATASNDRTARIWDAANGALLKTLVGHRDDVTSIAFSPDGLRVVTGSADLSIQIWDAASGGRLMVLNQPEPTKSVAFSPDGRSVLTTTGSDARIWRVLRATEETNLPWPVLATTQDLIEDTKRMVPRCLQKRQRSEAFLDGKTPPWCINMNKRYTFFGD